MTFSKTENFPRFLKRRHSGFAAYSAVSKNQIKASEMSYPAYLLFWLRTSSNHTLTQACSDSSFKLLAQNCGVCRFWSHLGSKYCRDYQPCWKYSPGVLSALRQGFKYDGDVLNERQMHQIWLVKPFACCRLTLGIALLGLSMRSLADYWSIYPTVGGMLLVPGPCILTSRALITKPFCHPRECWTWNLWA